MGKVILKLRGREITEKDLGKIKEIIAKHYVLGRKRISRELSKHWQWYQPNGQFVPS
ncbi:hypothetical protein HZB07_00410, partial [Candidatus Saganbacteria bacterium]|nr:hypothetical protein [Candidatus Saganbacteria bacterium]